MAEAIIAELVKSITMRVGSSVWEKLVSAGDIDSQIKALQDIRNTIEATLLDAKSLQECSHSQRDVLEKLEHGLAKLIDFQDAKAAKAKQKQLMAGSKLTKQMCTFFSSSNQLVSSFRDARKIKAITGELNLATRNHSQFGTILNSSSSSRTRSLVNESGSHPNTDLIIGRDGDREKMVTLLLDSSRAAGILSVASIVGIGGVGKTTLAQYVCIHERIQNYFDVKFWVSAGPEFNVKDVLRKIVASVTGNEPLNYEMDQLQQHLFRAIVGNRFLLVLDGVWDQDSLRAEWLELKSLLRVGAQGSKVLITTRSDTVARIMGTEDPHMVGDFDEDHSWLLFKHVAFTRWHDPGMEIIGKEIAKQCPRVPFVIRAIGSLLAEKQTAREWHVFRDDQITNFTSYGRDVMGTLKLSYDHLDERLKRCVLYCSLFPKGFKFQKRDLIRLWISLGYVDGEFRNQSLVNVAEAYVSCLLNRGFFYCDERNIYECPKFFWMHNLMHDLVISIAGFKYKLADSITDEFDERVCHVSFAEGTKPCYASPSSLFQIKQLKSFLLPIEKRYFSELGGFLGEHEIFISRLQSLRVLRMHGLGINKLPRSLGDLIHLRYLDVSFNAFHKLPKSVTQLVNLYSLDLSYCKNLEELPKDINKLVMLRHLIIRGCFSLSRMPKGLGKLTGLETLDYFVVGRPSNSFTLSGSKNDLVCGLADLRHFDNINGGLEISLVHRSEDVVSEAKAANLHKKEKITNFSIDFSRSTIEEDEMVFDNLKPGANLEILRITNYAGKQLACWMREGIHCWLPNLVEVRIYDCNGCRYLCSFGRLPHLQLLTLRNMDKVEYIENGNSSINDNTIGLVDELSSTPLFPSLECLWVENMPKLKGWWSVTDTAQDRGLYQLQTRIPAFPKLDTLGMDMRTLVILLVKVFPQGIASLQSLYVVGNNIETAEQSGILFKNHLPMLHDLTFKYMKVLPEEFQGMSLECLFITDCECLEEIPDWIDSLTSLEILVIENCPRLKSLPSQINNLSNLNLLIIKECSRELVERCQEPGGEDWPNIQHIPDISIHIAKINRR